mgnify:CR=1 FL=1
MSESSKTPIPFQSNRRFSVLEILQFIVLAALILYFGKTLFIPLSFSLLISFILYPICKWMETKGINKGVSIIISILSCKLFNLLDFNNEHNTYSITCLDSHESNNFKCLSLLMSQFFIKY